MKDEMLMIHVSDLSYIG